MIYAIEVLRFEKRNLEQRIQEFSWKLGEIPLNPNTMENRRQLSDAIAIQEKRKGEVIDALVLIDPQLKLTK